MERERPVFVVTRLAGTGALIGVLLAVPAWYVAATAQEWTLRQIASQPALWAAGFALLGGLAGAWRGGELVRLHRVVSRVLPCPDLERLAARLGDLGYDEGTRRDGVRVFHPRKRLVPRTHVAVSLGDGAALLEGPVVVIDALAAEHA